MTITGSDVRALRSMAHHLNPVVQIGKSDVNDAVAQQASEALNAHELIKCAVLDTSNLTTREAANALAEATGAEVIQVIGHRFSLYRYSEKKGIEHIL